MESLRNEPVIMSGNGGMGYPGGNSGGDLLTPLLFASMLGGGLGANRGYGYAGPALVEASALYTQQGLADARRDTKDSESEIRETLHTNALANASEFRSLDREISTLGRENLAGRYENQLATKDMAFQLTNKVDRETDSLRRLAFENKVDTDKQFCDLRHQISDSINNLEKREMQREIDTLRRLRENDRFEDIERVLRQIARNTDTPRTSTP